MSRPQVPYVTLNNGLKMPQLGFGVFRVDPGEATEQAVLTAIKAGYRLIDTASAYFNEKSVGEAIRKSGVPREELFIVTKLWLQDAGYEEAKKAFQTSLDNLGLDYLDLYLIHQPFGDYYGAWRAMEELYDAGKVKAIGVCNFNEARLVDLVLHSRIRPAIDQVEFHPFFQEKGLCEIAKKHNIQLNAWGPLAEGNYGIFTNETLSAIAAAHGKSVAQVVLRWEIQKGIVIIPKSLKPERVAQNIDHCDFSLTDAEMAEIAKLDTNHSEIVDHQSGAFVEYLHTLKIHE